MRFRSLASQVQRADEADGGTAGGSSATATKLAPWDGALYAANTAHHRRYDDDFLATLPLQATSRVLDVGCGSGDLTATLAAIVCDGEVVGLDPQASLLAEAAAVARPNQRFIESTAQAMGDHVEPGSFDAVVSRAALHWLPWSDHAPVVDAFATAVLPGGVVRIECGGHGNVPEIVRYLDAVAQPFGGARCPWTFAHAADYLPVLEAAGLSVDGGSVRLNAQRRAFDRDSILGWLESQAVQAYDFAFAPDDRAAFRAAALGRVDELRRADGTYDITYVRLDILAFRPA